MNFLGPSLYCGIGQHCKKYMQLFEPSVYIDYNYEDINKKLMKDKPVFMFVIPTQQAFNAIETVKQLTNNIIPMTVCETETVHEDYGKLFDYFDKIYAPSYFCKKILERQFNKPVGIIPPYIPVPRNILVDKLPKYTFYHIGNILDPRKNINLLIKTFLELNLENCDLVIKATCKQEVKVYLPNVYIINEGLIDDLRITKMHLSFDCYVSTSKSEGVGMGALEACVNNKPVIVPEYGGAKDYIKTPFFIKCGRSKLEQDDFLFKKGMEWGEPDAESLKTHMKYCYDNKITNFNHDYTKNLVSSDMVRRAFSNAQT